MRYTIFILHYIKKIVNYILKLLKAFTGNTFNNIAKDRQVRINTVGTRPLSTSVKKCNRAHNRSIVSPYFFGKALCGMLNGSINFFGWWYKLSSRGVYRLKIQY